MRLLLSGALAVLVLATGCSDWQEMYREQRSETRRLRVQVINAATRESQLWEKIVDLRNQLSDSTPRDTIYTDIETVVRTVYECYEGEQVIDCDNISIPVHCDSLGFISTDRLRYRWKIFSRPVPDSVRTSPERLEAMREVLSEPVTE